MESLTFLRWWLSWQSTEDIFPYSIKHFHFFPQTQFALAAGGIVIDFSFKQVH